MAENSIKYYNRTFEECRDGILDMTRKYYGDVFDNTNDASVGSWIIDVAADVYDALSYNIDRAYQETSIESAQSRKTVIAMAKNNGCKIPGPKCAVVEVELSCVLPMNNGMVDGTSYNLSVADESFAPVVKRGTLFSNGSNIFELSEDVDFAQQFDSNGISNRQIIPIRDSNGMITSYQYKKTSIAVAGRSRIYKKIISPSDVVPFMTVRIPDTNVANVESILLKQGTINDNNVSLSDFYVDREAFEDANGSPTQRFFEVDSLSDLYRWGYEEQETTGSNGAVHYSPVWDVIDAISIDGNEEPIRIAMRGIWKRLKNKFVSEFDENGNISVVFGPGLRNKYGKIPTDATMFTQYMMSRMEANDYLGVLPEPNSTMFVLYRVGGGEISNIPAGSLNAIVSMNYDLVGNCSDNLNAEKKAAVLKSISVTNTTPSYGGKNAPSINEIRVLSKYGSSSQNRCVTVRDYYARLMEIHPRFGSPFRFSVAEENNKIVVYTLGLDYQGRLSTPLSETVAENMKRYLSMYKMVNDFVEIRSGKVINVGFEIDIFVDKSYDRGEVARRLIDLVRGYMDVRAHQMGDSIFLGDLEKEISKEDGVVNLIDLRCYNKVGNGYSEDTITQSLVQRTDCDYVNYGHEGDNEFNERQIDLSDSDKTLFSEIYSMFEVKYDNDIKINMKVR